MAPPNVPAAKLNPILLVIIAVAVLIVIVLAVVALQQRTGAPEEDLDTAERGGAVLAVSATPVPTSPDTDKDGWLNIDDPLPNSPNNLDNDTLANHLDNDDDNDGILDARDKYPLDQNNNGTPDAAERRIKGERFDGDGDGRPDLAELRRVALAEAEKLGLRISTNVLHLADVPAQVFRSLPSGWNYVCADKDNDGNPDPTDRYDRSFGGSYTAYTHDGKWEDNYNRYASEGKKYGFVHAGYTGAPGSEPPRYEYQSAWASYVPGSSYPPGDPHSSFYGSVPTSEQGYYYTTHPPESTYTVPPGTTPPTYDSSGGTAPPPTHEEQPPPPSYP